MMLRPGLLKPGGPAPRRFTISPAVSSKTTWDLDVDGPLNLGTAGSWTIVPETTIEFVCDGWGAAGGSQFSQGGAGGHTGATVTLQAGVSYTLYVASCGVSPTTAGTPGGGSGGTGSPNGASGGGYSGIRGTSDGAPILIAPGGGGGGFGGAGGAGGGATGQDGAPYDSNDYGRGGTQTAGGAGAPGGQAGSAYQGGNAPSGEYRGGGGGGGRYGGGSGVYDGDGGAGGGAGGSGFLDPVATRDGTLDAGNRTTPGLSTHPQRANAGSIGFPGRLILA